VTVITCAPNFPQGKIYPGYRNQFRSRETIDGIEVIRVWSYVTANEGFFKRTLDYISFAISSFIIGLFEKADIIIATSPQFFTTFSGAGLSFFKRKPWIFEVRDLWPESLVAVGATKNPAVIRMLERIELALYRHAARVIVVTDAFKTNLVARDIDPSKIDVVTNGADLDLWKPRTRDSALIEKLGLSGKFIIAYIGTHGMAHGLDFIIKSAKKIENENIHFLFIGDGSEKEKIISISKSLNVKNVTFLPPIPKDLVPKYLSCADAALVSLKRSETFKSVIPSKIFEAAAMGKPVLLGVEGQAKEISEKFNIGIAFEPENDEAFRSAVQLMASNSDTYVKFQEGCGALARAYDRNLLAEKMLTIIRYTK